ncbi:hypothetical protein [Rhizobium sp. R635]|uniref:hypothetical protein n=1 Tax=Rhizobium sp. R635 TaxID=1764275 RepID=UPI00167D8056|nr:hypothetical protein [Rhizobium sp. R635]
MPRHGLGLALAAQAAVISFEMASFFAIALRFALAAPILIACKVILSRAGSASSDFVRW